MKRFRSLQWVAVVVVVALVAALVPTITRAEAAGGMINYGDIVYGTLNNVNYFEIWQFNGQQGDRIRITMTGDGVLDPYLGLIEATSEQVLVEDDDSGGNSNALIETTLPSSGQFLIIATRYNFDTGTSQGNYSLELSGGAGLQQNVSYTSGPEEIEPGVYFMGDLVLAEPVSGQLDDSSFFQIYSVELQAGTDVVVAMFADSSMLDPYVVFADEDGNVLAEDDDSGPDIGGAKTDSYLLLSISQSGTYLVGATRAGIDLGKSSGAYSLLVGVPEQDTPDPVNQPMPAGMEYLGEIAFGASVSGSITANSFMHLYDFYGEAGQMVTINMTGADGLDAYLGLLDPNDQVIAEDDDSAGDLNAQIAIRLPESGWYVIAATRVGIDEGTSTGGYSLQLFEGTPQPANETSGIAGFGGLPGRAFQTEDATFYLRGFGSTDNPAKATPLEQFVTPDEDLPGRSFQVDDVKFALNGFGATDDPAKASPLARYLSQ
ncbi:MAG: hypothetical protein GX573_27385 [Chloroflexi bacterium]|nr:hypothetical protein [Chloroflexota bacterium]